MRCSYNMELYTKPGDYKNRHKVHIILFLGRFCHERHLKYVEMNKCARQMIQGTFVRHSNSFQIG